MRKLCIGLSIFISGILMTSCHGDRGGKTMSSYETNDVDNVGSFYDHTDSLTSSEKMGREIWYKATAGNNRFH